MKITWVDELPGRPYQRKRGFYQPRGSSADLFDHARELTANPMRWAEYPRHIASPRQARDIATYIGEGKLAAYPPSGGFEATQRGDKIYIRHNPDGISPITRAFYDGLYKGRLEVLTEVRRAFGSFHQNLLNIPDWDKPRSRDARIRPKGSRSKRDEK